MWLLNVLNVPESIMLFDKNAYDLIAVKYASTLEYELYYFE